MGTLPNRDIQVPTAEEEAAVMRDHDILLKIAELKGQLSPSKRARADSDIVAQEKGTSQRQASDAGTGRATYSRNEEVTSALFDNSSDHTPSKAKKPYWSGISLANSDTLRQGNEIAPILLKSLSKGVFVSLADFTPAVLNAAARGTKSIRTRSIRLDDDLLPTDVAVIDNSWTRDSTLNKGDWNDAYINLILAITSQAVGMTSEQQRFFTELHDYIYNHEYAANGRDWAVMAQVDVEVRTAWFATPRTFDKTWVDHIITRRVLEAMVQAASYTSGGDSTHRQPSHLSDNHPISTNNRVRRQASQVHMANASKNDNPNASKNDNPDHRLLPASGSMPFRSSTGATPDLRCWICKGPHQAAACQAQGKYAYYRLDRRRIVRQSDGAGFCGGYNSRSGCKRSSCDRLHECISCGSSTHGAGDEVC